MRLLNQQETNWPEWVRGWRDCEKGATHRDQGEDYNRGFARCYEWFEIKTEMGLRRKVYEHQA